MYSGEVVERERERRPYEKERETKVIIKGYFGNNCGWKNMIVFFQIYMVSWKIG